MHSSFAKAIHTDPPEWHHQSCPEASLHLNQLFVTLRYPTHGLDENLAFRKLFRQCLNSHLLLSSHCYSHSSPVCNPFPGTSSQTHRHPPQRPHQWVTEADEEAPCSHVQGEPCDRMHFSSRSLSCTILSPNPTTWPERPLHFQRGKKKYPKSFRICNINIKKPTSRATAAAISISTYSKSLPSNCAPWCHNYNPQSTCFLCQITRNLIPITINIYCAKIKMLIQPNGQNLSPAVMAAFLWARERPRVSKQWTS